MNAAAPQSGTSLVDVVDLSPKKRPKPRPPSPPPAAAASSRESSSRVPVWAARAVFRSSLARGERIGAGPFLRAWVRMLLVASRWWQIASLYRANAKFRPAWEPRFICFRLARDLGPIIGAALAVEGFLHWPRIPRHRTTSTLAGWSC
jgi:hypothetical protein